MIRKTSIFLLLISFLGISNKSYTEEIQKSESGKVELSKKEEEEVRCLAANVFFEARGEPERGKTLVALVTLNRKSSDDFPHNVCSVVKQRNSRGCQFSWYCDTSKKSRFEKRKLSANKPENYHTIYNLSRKTYIKYPDITDSKLKKIMYFQSKTINSTSKKPTYIVGNHKFYNTI